MIPSYAERMSYLAYEKVAPTYSRFMPGVTVQRPMFCCPHCGTQRDPLPQNETMQCVGCDLHMQAGVSYLHVWRPLPLVDATRPLQAAE